MPYGYLTDPQLARDFWAVYTVEPEAQGGARRTTRKRSTTRKRTAAAKR
jgi:hypothetical protein